MPLPNTRPTRLVAMSRALAQLFTRAPRPETKAGVMATVVRLESLGQPLWSQRDYAAFAREGMTQNPVVFRSVRMIAEAAASGPLAACGAAIAADDSARGGAPWPGCAFAGIAHANDIRTTRAVAFNAVARVPNGVTQFHRFVGSSGEMELPMGEGQWERRRACANWLPMAGPLRQIRRSATSSNRSYAGNQTRTVEPHSSAKRPQSLIDR